MMNKFILFFLCSSVGLQAELSLSPIFGDGMVLQAGETVTVWGRATAAATIEVDFAGQKKSVVVNNQGRWRLALDAMEPCSRGRDLHIRSLNAADAGITFKDVLVGEVWFAGGQSNMAFHMASLEGADAILAEVEQNSNVRFVQIPVTEFGPINRRRVQWKIADRQSVKSFSAVAYFFAANLQRRLGVPVGIVGSYRGGTWNENWMTSDSIKSEPELRYLLDKYSREYAQFATPDAYESAYQDYLAQVKAWTAAGGWSSGRRPMAPMGPKAYQRPSGLYECMIQPLQPYTIKGVIWYQGEGNSSRHKEFRTLFPAFVAGWRQTWGSPNLPFYFVQLPPYKDKTWPPFRQAQLDCYQKIDHCGMVVSEGCGDLNDIHPRTKKPIGDRLATAISAEVYGHRHVHYGPMLDTVSFKKGQALVRFNHSGSGLVLNANASEAFEIAGLDQVFYPAQYKLNQDSIRLWHPQVESPAYVRYAYKPYPQMHLFNKEGLPASPFTTLDAR